MCFQRDQSSHPARHGACTNSAGCRRKEVCQQLQLTQAQHRCLEPELQLGTNHMDSTSMRAWGSVPLRPIFSPEQAQFLRTYMPAYPSTLTHRFLQLHQEKTYRLAQASKRQHDQNFHSGLMLGNSTCRFLRNLRARGT